ncbi:hypothetical protein [Streptomyces sp. NBC_00334]|uniref:hypothetical protein n=1 Tax=Streptomyces sp. NBC_00334 TaxID=2975713 RepID=UPI002E295444|nr:hypothetical protein [Streptomyces sp. NBC_00334]
MTGNGGVEMGALAARSRALAVLRVRSRALAVALLPAAAAVILLVGGSSGRLTGAGWDALRWAVCVLALLVLPAAAGVALVVARSRPATTPTVTVAEESAPDLYRMVRDLADRLDVPAPSAIALTPDCDSWLEDRTHATHGPPPALKHDDDLTGPGGPARRRSAPTAPVLVIGSPFLWWMRVGELRAVLAPVVAGTGPSAHPDIAAARRFIRGLDAAVAVASVRRRDPLSRVVCAGLDRVSRLLLRSCRGHATEMERGVAAAAAERAQAVDYGLRIVAQEQVGLAYAGWDRLLTRVALPAWRMGRWPSRLDVGVVAALTELSRRDRLAEGFASRLGERPACDLLEEPGAMDEAVSLLAARLFHGGPAETGPDWSPVGWDEYPEEVVDRTWRTDAARLHRVLDTLGVRREAQGTPPGTDGPTLARLLDHLTTPGHATTDDPPGTTTTTTTTTTVAEGEAAAETAPSAGAESPVRPEPTSGTPARPGAPTLPTNAPLSPSDANGAPHPPSGDPDTPADVPPGAAGSDALADAAPRQPGGHDAPLSASGPNGVPHLPSGGPDTPADVPPTAPGLDAPAPSPSGADATAPQRAGGHDAPHPPSADPGTPTGVAPSPPGANAADTAPQRAGDHDAPHSPTGADADAPHPPTDGPHAPADHLRTPLDDEDDLDGTTARGAALAAGLSAQLAREEAEGRLTGAGGAPAAGAGGPDAVLWDDRALPLLPLQPPRTGREILTAHVTAMVCCAAMDTAGAAPGLDWLDGPSLLFDGARAADLAPGVLSLVETGDPGPLRAWMTDLGIRPEKPVRLV